VTNLVELIRQGKIKRSFHTRNKLNYPGLVSHITQRATGKEPLFVEDGDYLYMLKLLKKSASEFNLQVFAFVLMPNHLHVLLRQDEGNLSNAMYNLFRLYAIYFNYKYNRKGHVFCGRFRQAACFDDYYLLSASVYIHLNPVRARIVDDYKKYRWSTWRLYCQDARLRTFVNWKFILGMIDTNYAGARKRYSELLGKALQYRGRDALEEKRAIGQFGFWLKKRFPDFIKVEDKSKTRDLLPDGYAGDIELDNIIEYLRDKKRLMFPGDIKARQFAVEQLKARGFSQDEIAANMGISRSTICRILSCR